MTETSTNTSQDPKTIAIIAHMTLIGWVIALVMHNNDKSKLGTFYLRQMLGLIGLQIAVYIALNILIRISFSLAMLSWVFYAGLLVLWILSLIGAINNEEKPVPLLGKQFQEWFTFIK